MREKVKTLSSDKFEEFNRFLERCYGHEYGFFTSYYADLYRNEKSFLDCCLIMEKNGKIVSHVGTFPICLKIGDSEFTCGGIGGVATAPEERGRGYMSRLLELSIERMRGKGWPLSFLCGDRQRYGHFSYEMCGMVLEMHLTRRSLKQGGGKKTDIEEVDPLLPENISFINRVYESLNIRTRRTSPSLKFGRRGIRVFCGPDGYLVSHGEHGGDLKISEVVSPEGREPDLISAALQQSGGNRADVNVAFGDAERVERIGKTASSWKIIPPGMFRIIDWPVLLDKLSPFLSLQAKNSPDFFVTIGCKFPGHIQAATIEISDGIWKTSEGRHAGTYVEMAATSLVGLLLGGAYSPQSAVFPDAPGNFLSVPVFIPELDQI